ncbi:MAG: FGGY-family carbohydrate kinase, partial [Candidatus Aerophobetes bacterium]|nr:FGGY-family carbohydrate kinase [Candidatus Aerophobetes bacterium]
ECIASIFKEPHLDKEMLEKNFACYPHVVPPFYITLAFNFTGGCLLRWFRDTLGKEEREKAKKRDEDVYSILIDEASSKPSSLFLLPHFTTTGTPYMDTTSSGAVLGLSLNTSKSDLIKAILEGISFEMKYNLSLLEGIGIPISELRAIGGGAKSRKWLQLKADLYDKKVVSLQISEAASLGAAILAGVAIGEYKSIDEAVDTAVKKKEVFYPRREEAKIYQEKFQIYEDIYPTLRNLNHRINTMQEKIK